MKKIIFLIIFLGLIVALPSFVKANSLTVTATVGDTVLILKGYTSPNSLVTFKENGVVIGTTTSARDGAFEKQFLNQSPGIHIIQIYATDPDNLTTITIKQSLTLIQFQTLTLDTIYLPPTIKINHSSFTKGDKIKISGYTKPSSLVNIEITGQTGVLKLISSNSRGYYQTEIDTSNFNLGNHLITASLQADLSTTSTKSESLNFTINPAPTVSPPDPTQETTIVVSTPTPTPTPTPPVCRFYYPNLCFFDSNKNEEIETKTELVNFILGFIRYFSKPIANVFDINRDRMVDVIDLSIILFFSKPAEGSQVLSAMTRNFDEKNILGASSADFDIEIIPRGNRLLDYLTSLFMIEFIIGIPFFIIFIILIFLSKKHVQR